DGASGLHLVIQVTVSVDLVGNTGVVQGLQQHDVDHLAAAADVQLSGSAPDNLDIVDLGCTDPRQSGTGLIILARHALAVDQDLLTAAASESASAAAASRAG